MYIFRAIRYQYKMTKASQSFRGDFKIVKGFLNPFQPPIKNVLMTKVHLKDGKTVVGRLGEIPFIFL